MLVVFKVPVVAVVTEPIVAGSVAIVALHFNVTALSAGTVVMEHARIDGLTRFTAGVEGFNSGHGASQYFRVVVRKAVHVMREFSFLAIREKVNGSTEWSFDSYPVYGKNRGPSVPNRTIYKAPRPRRRASPRT
jgi:hypothetical protein